jgi:hypothetical protein
VGQLLLEERAFRLREPIGFLARHAAKADQVVPVALVDRRPGRDRAIELRLREGGLVPLVVPVTSVPVEIDHHVAVELPAELHREARHVHDGLEILAVHVEDRNLEHARDVGGIRRRPAFFGKRGESDLIVHDDVERAAGLVACELAHVEHFLHHALARERGVAVDQEHHALVADRVAGAVLLGAHPADRDGIDVFEMARVVAEREMHRPPALRLQIGAVAEVILHVALPHVHLGIGILELAEDAARSLPQDVGEHVEPPAVRHADHDLALPLSRSGLDHEIEERDQGL